MSDSPESGFKIKPPHLPEEFDFDSPQKLLSWVEQLRNEWQWLSTIPPVRQAWAEQESHLRGIQNAANEWMRSPTHQDTKERTKSTVQAEINYLFEPNNPLFGNAAASSLIKKAKLEQSDATAAGLFAVLTRCALRFDDTVPESFFAGIIRGFLFQNEIEWAATAHRKVLEDLELQYKQRLADQETRLQQLEGTNHELNEVYNLALTEKSAALEELKTNQTSLLDDLHAAKDKKFEDLATEHAAKLKAFEDFYNNKLALQKPVEYWTTRHSSHVKLAWWFAGLSLTSLAGTGWGLICAIQWAFGSLKPDENPKHWEVGVVVVATFISVWLIRILVRLFLSHQHLATDAAQRITMVQTYLSLSQEAGGVAKEDRSIILQQLFRSTSDGIVKDDGTPPGLLEFLSRK
jgi:hypothetical protein